MKNQGLLSADKKSLRLNKLSVSVLAMCVVSSVSPMAYAQPTGAQVVAGSAEIERNGNQTLITNSNGTIINWQDFSIANQEAVRFLQQNASSAVLNRVVSNIPSSILGELTSNGRVFVINRNGLVIGKDARIDTAGFVGSTLDMSDADFLAGRMKFSGNGGKLENHGYIASGPNGEVVLIAPTVENHGIIEAKDGRILLAAGREVTLHSAQAGGVSYRISAPEDKVINIGKLVAENGSVRVFADQILQQGTVSANRVTRSADGTIVLEADSEIKVSGNLSAQGENQAGGEIQVLGDEVTVTNADINASGEGGGKILIGGDYQGKGDVKNAKNTDVDVNTTIQADGGKKGKGGWVIVWSDNTTTSLGKITARGGSESGDGGFIETSGKKTLNFGQAADASATNGKAGTWLLDPEDIVIDEARASSIETSLNGGSNVEVKTSDTGEGEGNITVAAPITKSEGDSAVTLTLDAHNRVDVNAPITSTAGALNVNIKTGRKVAQATIETTENDTSSESQPVNDTEQATSDNSDQAANQNTENTAETVSSDSNDSATDNTDTQDASNSDASAGNTDTVANTESDSSNTDTETNSSDQSTEVASQPNTETGTDTNSESATTNTGDTSQTSNESVASTDTEQSSAESADNNTDSQSTETDSSSAQANAQVTQTAAQATNTAPSVHNSTSSKADVWIDDSVNQVVIKNDIITGGGTVSIDAGESGDVVIGSDIDTTDKTGNAAGDITIEGKRIVVVDDAQVDASAEEAGDIHIGGGQEGKDESIRNSSQLYTAAGTKISADGGENGDGGRVILFSEDGTRVDGDVTAKGGNQSGDGGFIETSGLKGFVITSSPNATATNGKGGEWLIDPFDITISNSTPLNVDTGTPSNTFPTASGANLDANVLAAQLDGGTSVTINTTGGGGTTEQGNITVVDAITTGMSSGATLTLNADNNIEINAVISNDGSIFLNAANDINVNNNLSVTGSVGDLNLSADTDSSGVGTVIINNVDAVTGQVVNRTINSTNGDINITGNDVSILAAECGGTSSTLCGTTGPTLNMSAVNINIGTLVAPIAGDVEIKNEEIPGSADGGIISINASGAFTSSVDGNFAFQGRVPSSANINAAASVISVGGNFISNNSAVNSTSQLDVSANNLQLTNSTLQSQDQLQVSVLNNLEMDGGTIMAATGGAPSSPGNGITTQNLIVAGSSSIDNQLSGVGMSLILNGNTNINVAGSGTLNLRSVNVTNNGIFDWQQGNITVSTLQVPSGFSNNGTLRLNAEGGSVFILDSPIVNNSSGLITKDAGVGDSEIANPSGDAITNAGTVEINSGGLLINFGNYLQTDGETVLQGGNLTTADGGIVFQGGNIFGGTSASITTGGAFTSVFPVSLTNTTVNPGFSPGRLVFNNLNASGGGNTFVFEIDGPSSDPNSYDRIFVSGTATGIETATNTIQIIPGPGVPFVIPEPPGTNAGDVLFQDNYELFSADSGLVSGMVANVTPYSGPPNTTGTASFNTASGVLEYELQQIGVGTPVTPPPAPKPAPKPVAEPAPTPAPAVPEPDVIVIIVDETPLALPVDIVQVLVSLDQEEQQAYLESERVRERLKKVNMCVGNS